MVCHPVQDGLQNYLSNLSNLRDLTHILSPYIDDIYLQGDSELE